MEIVKPRIFRVWSSRRGVMEWGVSNIPEGRWGVGISQQLRYDWRQAQIWCNAMNRKTQNACA